MTDDLLRRELERMSPEVDSRGVWDSLQSRMVRARRRHVALVASGGFALAALLVVGALQLLPDEELPVVSTTSTTSVTSTTTPPTTTTTSTLPTTTTTVPSTTSLPPPTTVVDDGTLSFRFGELTPGTYRSGSFAIPLTIEIGEGFSSLLELPDQIELGRVPLDPAFGIGFEQSFSLLATRPDDPYTAVADAVAADRINVLERSETEIGGRPAIRIDATIDGPFILQSLSPSDTSFVAAAGANPLRFYMIDAPAGTLVVWIEADASVFDGFAADVETALATLAFPNG